MNNITNGACKYHDEIDAHYKDYGVGESVEQRYNHWKKLYPDTHMTHCDTIQDYVNAIEFCWFEEHFPDRVEYM